MEDAALSAFSVFFTQTPSFLTYQRMMAGSKGESNAQSLFGVQMIDRLLLERVPLAGIARVLQLSESWLQQYVNQC